ASAALLAALPYLSTSPEQLRAARAAVARAPEPPEPPAASTVFLSVHRGLHRQIRAYLLGLLSARLGDAGAAARYASALDTMSGPGAEAGSLPRDLAAGIRAESAMRAGRPAEALALLAASRRERWYELATASPFFAQSRERFVQAEALAALGRDPEAAELYRSFTGEGSPFDLTYSAPAALRLGAIAERAGRREEAADHYARVLEAWADADGELQPILREARKGLERVKREP
ncbi:MAG TPA: hypothetical protein VFK09_00175, partial [Gemmatimonadales bacterium]|nr:hypothetical protein [Gemmatimonadales bacterium]